MKKRKLPSVVTILILTLITVVVWVTFDVYRLFNKPATPVVPESVSAELIPSFDQNTILKIESSIFLDEAIITDQVTNTDTQVVLPNQDVPNTPDATTAQE